MAKRRAHGDGSIYYRASDDRYVASVVLPNGKRKYMYRKSKQEAREALKQAQAQLEQGNLATSPQQSVQSFMQEWLKRKRLELKEGTYCYYKYNTECHILPSIGHIRLQKLTSAHIQSLYEDLQEKEDLSANTVRLIHGILRSALDLAVKWKKIAFNPARDVVVPRVEKKDRQFLTLEQALQLIEAAKKRWMIAGLITLAVATGMRRGELLALQWNDIDFDKHTVTINKSLAYHDVDGTGKKYKIETPKTKSGNRIVPLPDFALEALQTHRKQQLEARLAAPVWKKPQLVFTNSTGDYYWFKILAEQLKGILRDAGLPPMSFHGLRHSSVTILLAMGVDPIVIKQRVGHADIRTTLNVYGHVTPAMQDDATNKFDMHFKQAANKQI